MDSWHNDATSQTLHNQLWCQCPRSTSFKVQYIFFCTTDDFTKKIDKSSSAMVQQWRTQSNATDEEAGDAAPRARLQQQQGHRGEAAAAFDGEVGDGGRGCIAAGVSGVWHGATPQCGSRPPAAAGQPGGGGGSHGASRLSQGGCHELPQGGCHELPQGGCHKLCQGGCHKLLQGGCHKLP